MKNKKVLVAMSHKITEDQITDFGGEILISKEYTNHKCSAVSGKLQSYEIIDIAEALVSEALDSGCTHFALNGEPALLFYGWKLAMDHGLTVIQSTTERVSTDVVGDDGTITKTSVFKHIQWREII